MEVSARLLRERLPRVLEVARTHELMLYGVLDETRFGAIARSLSDFVALCEAKEKQTGQPVLIRAAW